MAHLASQSYGKSHVRLTKVTRHPDRHDLAELAVEIILEGAFHEDAVGESRPGGAHDG